MSSFLGYPYGMQGTGGTSNMLQQQLAQQQLGQLGQPSSFVNGFPGPVLTTDEIAWLRKLISSAPLQRHVLLSLDPNDKDAP